MINAFLDWAQEQPNGTFISLTPPPMINTSIRSPLAQTSLDRFFSTASRLGAQSCAGFAA